MLQSNVTEALYLLDKDGRIETWNASAERVKGYAAGEIIGQNFSTFFTQEDLAGGEPARVLAATLETGRFTTEAWRVRKGGGRFLARIAIDGGDTCAPRRSAIKRYSLSHTWAGVSERRPADGTNRYRVRRGAADGSTLDGKTKPQTGTKLRSRNFIADERGMC